MKCLLLLALFLAVARSGYSVDYPNCFLDSVDGADCFEADYQFNTIAECDGSSEFEGCSLNDRVFTGFMPDYIDGGQIDQWYQYGTSGFRFDSEEGWWDDWDDELDFGYSFGDTTWSSYDPTAKKSAVKRATFDDVTQCYNRRPVWVHLYSSQIKLSSNHDQTSTTTTFLSYSYQPKQGDWENWCDWYRDVDWAYDTPLQYPDFEDRQLTTQFRNLDAYSQTYRFFLDDSCKMFGNWFDYSAPSSKYHCYPQKGGEKWPSPEFCDTNYYYWSSIRYGCAEDPKIAECNSWYMSDDDFSADRRATNKVDRKTKRAEGKFAWYGDYDCWIAGHSWGYAALSPSLKAC